MNTRGGSVAATLKTNGVSVSYHVPSPPLFPDTHQMSNSCTLKPMYLDSKEFNQFQGNSCSSLKRSDTSSATLPVTWSNSSLDRKYSETDSQDCLSSSHNTDLNDSPPCVNGPVILLGDNFDPQVMTEDCQPCPREPSPSSTSNYSSTSGSMFYATFIPDRCINADEVSIVCNEYTQIETDSHVTDTTEDSDDPSSESVKDDALTTHLEEKNWKSTIRLPSLLDFWEKRNKENQFKKYASESNICKNQELPENGLRKIPKNKDFTSCEESFGEDSDFSVRSGYEDHIYEEVAAAPCNKTVVNEESGFFSYENPSVFRSTNYDIIEEPSEIDQDDFKDSDRDLDSPRDSNSFSGDNNVTIISVDYNTTNHINNNEPDACSKNPVKIIPYQLSSVKDLRKIFETNSSDQVS